MKRRLLCSKTNSHYLTSTLIIALSFLLGAFPHLDSTAAQRTESVPFDRPLTKSEEQWVERMFASLSLPEKIGQMIAADASAIFMNRESAEYQRLYHQIVNDKVGSVILFRSDVWATAILINRLQELARVPLLVSADLEMGPGMRLNDTVWWAPNMAVAATGDPIWARQQGEVTAREARAIGINWLYAPVADVNNNSDNPVINTRSYGEDPKLVASFVSAFIEGAQQAGALATAKHFPGHGDTTTDSHIGLPVVDVNSSRLNEIELVPFRAAIASRVGSIMSAHIALPQIEPELAPAVRAMTDKERETAEFLSLTESDAARVTVPGTLSSKVLTGMLRDELKFKGIITTDALSMAGVAARFDAGTSAVRAIKAGADIILKSPDIDAAIAAIKQAVASGEISQARIDESVRRILRAKAALGLNVRRTVQLDEVDRIVSNPESLRIAREIADRSMTLIRDEKKLLPITARRILNVTITDDEDRNVVQPFLAELRRRNLSVENVNFDNRSTLSERDVQSLQAQIDRADVITLSITVRTRSGKGKVALPEVSNLALRHLISSQRPVIAVLFGNPYLLEAIPDVPTCLVAYGIVPVSQRAAARAILGEIDIQGRLPVSLSSRYQRGYGIRVAHKN